MLCSVQYKAVVGRDNRLRSVVLDCPTSLGAYHIYHRHKLLGALHILDVGSHNVGEGGEDTHNLASLLVLQFAEEVVQLHHLGRLDIEGLARSRLVVDKAVELALISCRNGDYGTTITNRYRGVALDDAARLCRLQNRLQSLRDLSLVTTYLLANVSKLFRCIVAHRVALVDDSTNVRHNMPQRLYRLGKCYKSGVEVAIALVQELHKVTGRDERTSKLYHLGHLQEGALNLCLLDYLGDVVELLGWSLSLGDEYAFHLISQSVTA